MQVRDVMSRKPITIESSESCLEAVRRMHSARIRHLPVVDAGGRLVGIVTDRDLRHHLFSPAVFPVLGMTSLETLLAAAPVADLMASSVVTVRPEHTLADAAQIMMTRKIGSLPVVEAGRVVGILTETDMLRTIVRRDAEAACADIIVSFP